MFTHDTFCHFHFCSEIRLVCSQANTVRRLGDVEAVAFVNAELSEHILREDDSNRTSNGCNLYPRTHTEIITHVIT